MEIFFNDKKYGLDIKTNMQPKSEDEKNLQRKAILCLHRLSNCIEI